MKMKYLIRESAKVHRQKRAKKVPDTSGLANIRMSPAPEFESLGDEC